MRPNAAASQSEENEMTEVRPSCSLKPGVKELNNAASGALMPRSKQEGRKFFQYTATLIGETETARQKLSARLCSSSLI